MRSKLGQGAVTCFRGDLAEGGEMKTEQWKRQRELRRCRSYVFPL